MSTKPLPPLARRTAALRGAGALALAAATTGLAQNTAPAPSPDVAALRSEMRAEREAYEARITELERRLAAVERPGAASPAATGTTSTTASGASLEQRVATLERNTRENSEALEEVFAPNFVAEGLPKDATRNFELHGYLRAGYGVNQSGGGQQQITHPDGLFQIGPGRLGNEQDTYGELTFKYNFPTEEDGPRFAFQSTLAFKYAGDKNNYTTPGVGGVDNDGDGQIDQIRYDNGGDILFREAFVTASNVLATAPDVTFWAGQRFYDRHDIHVYDYYFLDMSGYGGGVEKIALGPGKLAVAYLGGTEDDFPVENNNWPTKQAVDIRWSELPAFGGKGMLWVAPMWATGGNGNPDVQFRDEFGVAAGWIQMNTLAKGFNKLGLQWGYGVASQFNTYISAINFQGADVIEDAETWQVTEQFVWQFSDQFSLMAAGIVNYLEGGTRYASGTDRLFASAVVRPIYMFTKHIGLETEFGFDWIDDVRYTPEKDSTTLGKITIAPVIKPSGSFWSRPEIRVYASYFFWNDEPGYYSPNGVGPGDRSSWNFGIQAETWW
jgi:maltoporin